MMIFSSIHAAKKEGFEEFDRHSPDMILVVKAFMGLDGKRRRMLALCKETLEG